MVDKTKQEKIILDAQKEVLEVLKEQPLFGHPVQSKIPTHWFCFMKIPSSEQLIATPSDSASQVVNDGLNISLNESSNEDSQISSNEDSQISSNDETSLNHNIHRLHPNLNFCSQALLN